MKKLLAVVEWVAWAVAILGFVAKWNVMPGGSILLILGLATLSTIYFLQSYLPSYSSFGNAASQTGPFGSSQSATLASAESSFLVDVLAPKIIGLSAAITFIGMLFKLMSWNGSRIMLIVGVGTLLTIVVIMALNQRMDRRAVIIAALGGLSLYVSSDTLVQQFHHDDPVLVEKMIYQNHHPRDRAAAQDVREYLKQKRAQR